MTALGLGLFTFFVLFPLFSNNPKNLLSKRLKNVPGPRPGDIDGLHEAVLRRRHHAMCDVHDKYGEVVQLQTVNGPVAYIRGADALGAVFGKSKIFQKTKGTFKGVS